MHLKGKRKYFFRDNFASSLSTFKLYNDVLEANSSAILVYWFPNIFILKLPLSFLQKDVIYLSSFLKKNTPEVSVVLLIYHLTFPLDNPLALLLFNEVKNTFFIVFHMA